MKLDISRTLNNRIFSTTLIRTTKDDPDYTEERILEDDFGSIEIDAGGKFELLIYQEEGEIKLGKYNQSSDISNLDCAVHKFIKDTDLIKVEVGTEITHTRDAKQINSLELSISKTRIIPDMVAEFECRIFEAIISSRITEGINTWCVYETKFETEDLEPIIISTPCLGGGA